MKILLFLSTLLTACTHVDEVVEKLGGKRPILCVDEGRQQVCRDKTARFWICGVGFDNPPCMLTDTPAKLFATEPAHAEVPQ